MYIALILFNTLPPTKPSPTSHLNHLSLLHLRARRQPVTHTEQRILHPRYLATRLVNREQLQGRLHNPSFTCVLGQSKARVFLLSVEPLGLKRYLPVRAFTIPSPPAVPGSQALTTAVDVEITSSMIMGLPATSTVTTGIFLSFSWMLVITYLSNFSKSRLRLDLWLLGK